MKNVLIEKKSSYYIIAINRPNDLNSINEDVLDELNLCLEIIEKDKSCLSVIITGSGDKAFIAGADIKSMSYMNEIQAMEFSKKGQCITNKIENFHIPIIAAINGYALGGGCELAMSCHIRYCSSSSILGQPEVSLGLIAGFGGTQRLSRIVGKSQALEILLSGKSISAEIALRIGLVNKIFNFEELLPECEKLAENISNNAPIAVYKTLKLVNKSFEYKINDGLEKECAEFKKIFKTRDTKEGLAAFKEKRAAKFKGY